MRIPQTTLTVLSTALLTTTATAHSWIEQLMVISPNGTFTGNPGYPRGNVLRTSPDFVDTELVHMIPNNNNKYEKGANMCMDSQTTRNQTEGSPRLQAKPGSGIALRYQENGHVTMPWASPSKPKNRGTIYVYGTTEPKENEKFGDIFKVWNEDGTGGDKRGKLLSKQNYDDGRCYQINDGSISKERQEKFKHQAAQPMGQDLWCQTDIPLPADAPSGKPYTLYWVWDWPTLPNKTMGLPDGKDQIYTTCMDVDATGNADTQSRTQAKYTVTDLNVASLPDQFADIHDGSVGNGGSQDGSSSSAVPAASSSAPAGAASSSAAAPSAPAAAAPHAAPQGAASSPPPQSPSSSDDTLAVNLGDGAQAGPSSTPAVAASAAMLAASSATASSLRQFQSNGPSFVTRTKYVTATACSN